MPQTMYIWKYVDVYDYTNDSSFSLAYIIIILCAYYIIIVLFIPNNKIS